MAAARQQWILGIRRSDSSRRLGDGASFTPLIPPNDRFYADPFVISSNDWTCIFIEEYEWAKRRGIISVISIDDNGCLSTPRPVLERPYHLSYPFVFKEGSEYYLIPETAQNGTIELYRSVEFPYEWRLEQVLLHNLRAADATLLWYEDRWWLFACTEPLDSARAQSDELSLFFADSFKGPWLEHPCNPIVADVRCARPAGGLFFHNGQLIRPAQDCAERYGHAINYRNVLTLNEYEYRESSAGRLEPTWMPGLLGTHTYNADDRFEVIDGLRMVRYRPRRRQRKRVPLH